MLVLKFGGTSVANAAAMLQIAAVLKEKKYPRNMVVVVSAMSGVTDMLISCYQKAGKQDNSYQEVIQQLETKHMEAIEQLVPYSYQIEVKGKIKLLLREFDIQTDAVLQQRLLAEATTAAYQEYFFVAALVGVLGILPALPWERFMHRPASDEIDSVITEAAHTPSPATSYEKDRA
jgi:aspartokinase/homoserine dehydrogenase 1